MHVVVRFFAVARERAGRDEEQIEVPSGATVAALLEAIGSKFPRVREVFPHLRVAVNQEMSARDRVLADGDEVALIPPVSGGAGPVEHLVVSADPIDETALARMVGSPDCGGLVTFAGTVRNENVGRSVEFLVYEAYPEMAVKQMREIVADARRQWDIRGVVILHRTGRLAIGETSVFVAVAAPHRDAAFQAARSCIDRVKKECSIWKKEVFHGGEAWVEGPAV